MLVIGAHGSFAGRRVYLCSYVLIYFVALVLQLFSTDRFTILSGHSTSALAVTVAFLLLAIVQAELLRRDFLD